MKLASLKSADPKNRDGRLVVVSDDLHWFTDAFLIAPTLQAALDDWERCGPELQGLAESLAHDAVPKGRFTSGRRTRPCRARTSGPTARPM
jgi:fumarylacetoacetate (FAA) hydrolase